MTVTRQEHGELLPNGETEFTGYDCMTNHSCDANHIFDESRHCIIATKSIHIGDQLTANYNSTNWDEYSNLNIFTCNCYGVIRGFKYLSVNEQQRLINMGGVSGYCLINYFRKSS